MKKKFKYQVFDGGKPCDCFNQKVDKSWEQSSYNTFEEAEIYALHWLGMYSPGFGILQVDKPFEYHTKSFIEIRKIND